MDYKQNTRTTGIVAEKDFPEREVFDKKKENEIGEELSWLNRNVEELLLAIENLGHRISPILSNEVKAVDSGKGYPERTTDLGRILQDQNSRIAKSINVIRELQDRVEL